MRRDVRTGHYRALVLRLRDFSTIADLVETDSRVLYAPSTFTHGKGYLLYVRAGNLLAHPFDPHSLQVSGEAMPIASKVYFFVPTGAADFSVSNTGALAYQSYVSRSQLAWVDRTGNQLATVGPAKINLKSARLSPDGQRLATAIYDIERGEQDLWIFDLKTNSGRRLSSEPALRDAPVWSPDSTRLAFLHQADDMPPRVHCAAWERTIRKKRPRPAISKCQPTGLRMGASSLSGIPDFHGSQTKRKGTSGCSIWPVTGRQFHY